MTLTRNPNLDITKVSSFRLGELQFKPWSRQKYIVFTKYVATIKFSQPLTAELYAQWYEIRKNASTMSVNQNTWFADYATKLRNCHQDTNE